MTLKQKEDYDFLSAARIQELCPDTDAPVYVFEETDSTNNYAKQLVQSQAPHGTAVIADHQTAGRGRRGHSFYSPKSTGLYFSLIIHPRFQNLLSRVTPAAAVSCVEAIAETTGIHPGIKWVNDLYIEKKKVGGILCEAVRNSASESIEAVVIGIGINCKQTSFPDELKETAGSLNAESLSRNVLAASLRRHLLYWTEHLDDPKLMELYRRDSLVLHKEVTYFFNMEKYTGTVMAINDDGNLIIQKSDGSTQVLQSGEISLCSW